MLFRRVCEGSTGEALPNGYCKLEALDEVDGRSLVVQPPSYGSYVVQANQVSPKATSHTLVYLLPLHPLGYKVPSRVGGFSLKYFLILALWAGPTSCPNPKREAQRNSTSTCEAAPHGLEALNSTLQLRMPFAAAPLFPLQDKNWRICALHAGLAMRPQLR